MGDAPYPSPRPKTGADQTGHLPPADGLASSLRARPIAHGDQVLKVAFNQAVGSVTNGGPAAAAVSRPTGLSSDALRERLARLEQARQEQQAEMAAAWTAIEAALHAIAGNMPLATLHDLLKRRTAAWRSYYVQATPHHDRLTDLQQEIADMEQQRPTAETTGRLIALRAEAASLQTQTDQAWAELNDHLRKVDGPFTVSSRLSPDLAKRLLDAQDAMAQTCLMTIADLERQMADLQTQLHDAEGAR